MINSILNFFKNGVNKVKSWFFTNKEPIIQDWMKDFPNKWPEPSTHSNLEVNLKPSVNILSKTLSKILYKGYIFGLAILGGLLGTVTIYMLVYVNLEIYAYIKYYLLSNEQDFNIFLQKYLDFHSELHNFFIENIKIKSELKESIVIKNPGTPAETTAIRTSDLSKCFKTLFWISIGNLFVFGALTTLTVCIHQTA